MAIRNKSGQGIEDIESELGVRIGERGDYIAVKAAEIGDGLVDGNRPSQSEVDDLRDAMEELAQALAAVGELDELDETP